MNGLDYLDRAKRLIDEQNPPDESPLTTASRDLRAARAAIDGLLTAARDIRASIAVAPDTSLGWINDKLGAALNKFEVK